MSDCLFCRIVAGEIPSTFVHDDDEIVAFRDIEPRAPTHILVIPRRHIRSAAELTEADGPMLGRLFATAATIARDEGIADAGYRLVTNVGRWGGQTVFHLHVHLLGGRPLEWPPRMRRLGPVIGAGLIALLVMGCSSGSDPGAAAVAAPSIVPARPVSDAVLQTRAAIVDALGEHSITLADTQTPYRPAETPLLGAAPRAVYQAFMPEDQDKGLIVVYELPDTDRAAAAAAELQQFLATGPGRVQTPLGTVHVIRSLGTTVIVYDWLPEAAKDDRAPDIQRALETIGIDYPVG